MKIIKRGKMNPKAYRFKCLWCRSDLEAKPSELKAHVFDRNEQYYKFFCPVCEMERIVSERDCEEVGEDV